MTFVNEDLIKITEYNVLGKLPDPFIMDNGERMTSPSQWPERRKEIYKTAVELQYGTQPPKPEVFKVECLYKGRASDNYRITAGTKEKQVSFLMKVFNGEGDELCPAVVDGDMCFNYAFNKEFLETFTKNKVSYVLFDRTELANDIQFEGRRHGPLYDVYPEYTFGALGAWAWGYSRCVDALEQLGICDMNLIAFTGHSRGGKTAMLAGVLDERARIVNPNETNAGACGCYRIHMKALNEENWEGPNETLENLWDKFDFWLGEGMGEYTKRENELPFDCHFLKAMVAPRILLVGEAASDLWTNVVGTWQTSMAATEVFKYLGCEQNIYWYFRRGFHYHKVEDIERLIGVIDNIRYGTPIPKGFFETPFKKPELIYDWKCPEK